MMRIILIIALSLIISITNIVAQDGNVQKSADKVVIGGQVYYVHIVKEGDSLATLCKIYKVEEKEIIKENPEVFMGLRVGQALKIPAVISEDDTFLSDTKVIKHKVVQGETLYSLSRYYSVTQDDIINLNPGCEYGININQILRIPLISGIIQEEEEITDEDGLIPAKVVNLEFITYEVKPKDTYYSLKVRYGVTEEELKEANPILNEGLKYGLTIRIPQRLGIVQESLVFARVDSSEISQFAIFDRQDPYSFINPGKCHEKNTVNKTFDIALLLPFYLDKNDEEYYIDSSKFDDYGNRVFERKYYKSSYLYPRSRNFIQFYEGFILALEKLKEQGMSVNLHVFDIADDPVETQRILNLPKMFEMNMIIGPVFKDQVQIVSEFCKEQRIPLISPFTTSDELLEQNPFFIQVFPSEDIQMERYCSVISKHYRNNLVLIHNGDSLQYSFVKHVKNTLFSYVDEDTIISDLHFKEIAFNNDSVHHLEHGMNDSIPNIAVVPYNSETYVTDVVTKLTILKNMGYDIKVFGLANWNRFRNIDPEYYYNLDLTMIAPFYIDYSEPAVLDFIKLFRVEFGTEPNQYAMHGYDVGYYFLSALQSYDNHIIRCLPYHSVEVLQSKYNFIQWSKNSGFENIGISLIQYSEGYFIDRIEKGWFPTQGFFDD